MTVPTALDSRFRDLAAASGLLDAAFDTVESPLGELVVAVSDRGLLRISFDPDPDTLVEHLTRGIGSAVLRAPRAVDAARFELDEYFEGRRRAFDLGLDLRGTTPFTRQVLAELARVPFGQTATYGQLAARAGRPQAARAVGMVMNRNPIPIVLPCHRIVGASGDLVGYAGGLDRKIELLRHEGAIL